MRRINPSRFQVATRGTSRDINSQIVLNLVRAHQPISRADLARTMGVSRGAVTLIVNDLLEQKLIFEGATGETVRGRKPTFLYIDSRRRAVHRRRHPRQRDLPDARGPAGQAADRRHLVPDGRAIRSSWSRTLAARIKRLLADHPESTAARASASSCRAWSSTRRCACCTRRRSGWRNVNLREPLAAATGLAGADRELRPRLRAGPDVGAARRPRRPPAISCSSACRTASASA